MLTILGDFSRSTASAVVRVDDQLSGPDGTITGMRIGVLSTSPAAPTLDLTFLGTTLISHAQITDLLAAQPAASIGLDANSADVIADVPSLRFAPRVSMVQLTHLVETSKTINGTYRIAGADAEQVGELATTLESRTGVSAERLLAPLRGQSSDSGLIAGLLLGVLAAATVLLLLLLVFEAVRAFRVLGVHLLLGRSRWDVAFAQYRSVIIAALATGALSVGLVLLMAPGYAPTPTLLGAAAGAAAVGALPCLGCVAVGAFLLISVKPVDAILGRFSKRVLVSALAGFYILAIGALTATLVYLDGPLKEAGTLADVSQSWSAVGEERILYRTAAGEDQASFTGQSSEYQQDFYDWYRAIAGESGVQLINTQYFDQSVLDGWSGVFSSVPHQPFWYVAASPSALTAEGFPLSDDVVARAEAGERVFLLPDTWDDATRTAMQGWLTQKSEISYEPAIRTEYFDARAVGFEDYAPGTPLFSWSTEPEGRDGIVEAAILVTTPENMVPFESESLAAVGLQNSYVKLSPDAAARYATPSFFATFHLADNDVTFLPVSEFVAGLTKSIQSVLQLFGAVILLLGVFSLLMLAALTKLYATTHREAVAVKSMLGYRPLRIFMTAFALVGIVGAVAIAAAVVSSSTTAILGNVLIFAAQLMLFFVLARAYARLRLSSVLTE
ncbi:hypothetical protein [Microbacterium trichothecenolyticum]|uniref:FtsX-like permease family protein n=1 Tax=Microbacterium trichothecenolyticum TaxID=69370 RepID=A0ABU0TX11_MICTR|nr:hypothetical protein [Microbacterium trichothecenolyticum]MDQ1124190.1 hypothetical protein [Microbacterium trichothecenolyticum]